jgi:Zn-dependent M28 family amino/carboxypeptidase
VIITAHLDHLGMRNGDIYYGADDDGSGCASVLAMANAMAQAKKDGQGPRRSVLFMTFTGEEKGLFGSEYYVEHPVFPLSNTIANLNIDMIGRVDTVNGPATDYVYVIGANRTSDTLHAVNERMNAAYSGLKLDYKYNDPSEKLRLYYRSDHYNFIKKQVPSIFFFTGLHPDYHKPTDTADKIDYEKTARIARHIFHTAWELSHLPYRTDVKPQND